MRLSHYFRFLADNFVLEIVEESDYPIGDSSDKVIVTGRLIEKSGQRRTFSIEHGIPRFLPKSMSNYSDNFGIQWNKFKSTQFDSATGRPITETRFWGNSRWTLEELKGKVVLEVGSGAGRFTEVLSKTGATIISFDLSNAVAANYQNNSQKGDLLLFQGDIYDIPFPDGYFDYILCYGVLQHTPDPDLAYKAIFKKLKPGGKISIDYYRKYPYVTPWSTAKYFWRPLTKRLPPGLLLKVIKVYMPIWLPIDTFLRRIPKIGEKVVSVIMIPCWNYIDSGFTYSQRLQWAILDTFDALAPTYDFPKTKDEVEIMIASEENAAVEIFYGGTGIVANILKK